MSNPRFAGSPSAVRFQSPYGRFQRRYWWLAAPLGLIGLVGVPIGIFWNEGWEAGNHPLEPWAATLIIEIVAVGALLIVGYMGLSTWRQGRSPQRIAVTDTSLILPKGAFSSQERILPLAEIDTTLFNMGFVKQLQIKHGRRKFLITSALFPSDEAFERFVQHLLQ
jgi:hypothetical protein